jgi:hypothetical protein
MPQRIKDVGIRVSAPGSALVKACLDYLALRGVFAWRSNNTGIWDAKKRCWRFHGLKGVSDIHGVLDGGRFLAVECKEGRGQLTEEQRYYLAIVNELGGLGLVVCSVGELIGALDEAGV